MHSPRLILRTCEPSLHALLQQQPQKHHAQNSKCKKNKIHIYTYIETLIEKHRAEIDHSILLLTYLIYIVISTDIIILIEGDSVLASEIRENAAQRR